MGHEINYRTWTCGMYLRDVDTDIQDNERYLRRIENEIFAYMCMSPDQIRAKRSKKKADDECDNPCMNNAEYLSHVWEDLKEQWHETANTLHIARQLKNAMADNEYKVEVCPECLHQLRNEYDHEKGDWVWKCPEHGIIETPKTATLLNVEVDE